MKNSVKYVVATCGAILVFVAVFLICGIFIEPLLPETFHGYVYIGDFGTDNWLGLVFGIIAAASSFRASLKINKK